MNFARPLPSWALCWRQWSAEWSLKRRGFNIRTTAHADIAMAYNAMTTEEFDAINGRQQWANWRVIPKLIGERLPVRALRAIDLGCGTGGSTQALAHCCPPQSKIIGYEQAQHLVETAKRRSYHHRNGAPAFVTFRCQSIAATLCDDNGAPLANESIDLVNSSGVIGHHFDARGLSCLLEELRRIVRPLGIVALDSGPTLPFAQLTRIMKTLGCRKLGHERSCVFDRCAQVAFEMPRRPRE